MHDGQEKPTPNNVTLAFNNHSVSIAIHKGSFEVPLEYVNSEKFTLITDIGEDRIQIPDIPGTALRREFWTLHLAEQRYSEDFQFAIPKGTIVSESCILYFDSHYHESWFTIAKQCRSRIK